MSRSSSLAVLALSITVVTPAAFGVINAPTNVFGTAAASMGTNGADQWEMYVKYNSFGNGFMTPLTAANVAGNTTEAQLNAVYLGMDNVFGSNADSGNFLWGANGITVISPTISSAAYPTTGLLYLQDAIATNAAKFGNSGYDANGHQQLDLRVGFIQNATSAVTNMAIPTDPNRVDPSENTASGTMGVFFHYNTINGGATVLGGTGNTWTSGVNSTSEGLAFIKPTGLTYDAGVTNPLTSTKITSGGASTDTGVAYGSKEEVSARLIADPSVSGNVLLQVKIGNQITATSFNPSDARFGGGTFDWANAKPEIYIGSGSWGSGSTQIQHIGVFAPGDANGDGHVNALDTGALLANFGGTDKTYSQADFTQNGTVNALDTGVLLAHFGQPISAAVTDGTSSATNATAAGKVDLVVNVNTGDVMLVGGANANTNNYEVDSPTGVLIPANWNHNAGWVTALSTATGISEFTFGSPLSLNNASYDLGNIFPVGNAARNLSLLSTGSDFNENDGVVTYIVPEPASLGLITLGVVGMMIRRRNA